jgi:peptidoglycan glycosyltransferase
MMTSIHRLSRGLLAAFLMVALALGWWGIARRDVLLARDDNPRLVLEEQRIRRGTILDRNGVVLAETRLDADGEIATRRYPHPEAAPVVGYYSLRYGVGGIEAEYDDALRGITALTPAERLLNGVLHRPQIGSDVQLTLDLTVQQAAEAALGTRQGAVVVVSVPDGEVLALSSHPAFDPNDLEENWDDLMDDPAAPLINRATQGLYQPGTILQSALLGAAINVGLVSPSATWTGELAASVDGTTLPCAGDPASVDSLATAFAMACPAPFQSLAGRLERERFRAALADFRLLEAPTFALPTEASEPDALPSQADLALAAIGQSDLTVSPLQMALVASAFANHGQMPALRLVRATRAPGGVWEPITEEGHPLGTISRDSADDLVDLMALSVSRGAAQAADLPGQQVYGHAGLALSGPEAALNGWFIGFVRRPDGGAVAVVVLVEDVTDAAVAPGIGGQVLQAALAAIP